MKLHVVQRGPIRADLAVVELRTGVTEPPRGTIATIETEESLTVERVLAVARRMFEAAE